MNINILTRTSNRPNAFARCANSITAQTYKHINHLVAYDTLEDESYLDKYDHIVKFYMDEKKILNEAKQYEEEFKNFPYRFAPYNLYMNVLLENVKDGWIMVLDDDDMLASNTVIEEIVTNIENEDTVLVWKMKYPNEKTLPDEQSYLDKIPRSARIGSPCVLIHSKWNDILWDSYKGADFRFIAKQFKRIPYSKWIDKVYIEISPNGEGWGRRIDI